VEFPKGRSSDLLDAMTAHCDRLIATGMDADMVRRAVSDFGTNRSNRSRSAALIPIRSIFLIGADLQVRADL
jgi:hypothetical protein